MKKSKIVVVLVIVMAVALFFALDLGRFFSLDYIKTAQGEFAQLYATRPAFVIGAFFAAYVAVAALSLPTSARVETASERTFASSSVSARLKAPM